LLDKLRPAIIEELKMQNPLFFRSLANIKTLLEHGFELVKERKIVKFDEETIAELLFFD
jgi:hypothetical protein